MAKAYWIGCIRKVFDPGGGSPPPSTFWQRFTLPSTGGVLQVVP